MRTRAFVYPTPDAHPHAAGLQPLLREAHTAKSEKFLNKSLERGPWPAESPTKRAEPEGPDTRRRAATASFSFYGNIIIFFPKGE